MFDLKNIDFKKTDLEHGHRHYSFVGIQRKKDSDRLEFWLPLGFDNFPTDPNLDYKSVKSFFFKMYGTFKIYLERKGDDLKAEEKTTDRDGIHESESGFVFEIKNEEQPIFYGKLNALDKILEGYDELKISSLEKKHVVSQDIDYSKIHKYMHQAIFLDNDMIYLTEMIKSKTLLVKSKPPILQLFSFIFTEIKSEMGELESVSDYTFELYEIFKETYLQPDSSLFDEFNFSDTLNILRNILDEIDIYTTYKDDDYWHFYSAVESFLYGERTENQEGILWGISNFYDVWEDMCQSYMLRSIFKPQILFADISGRLENYFKLNPNPFSLKLNNFKERMIRPDLVYLSGIDYGGEDIFNKLYQKEAISNSTQKRYKIWFKNLPKEIFDGCKLILNRYSLNNSVKESDLEDFNSELSQYIYSIDFSEVFKLKSLLTISINIIDYKYMKVLDYQVYNPNYVDNHGENKIKDDIHKQLIYEWAFQNNYENVQTESEFWIPYYSESDSFDDSKILAEEITNRTFIKSGIKVFKINFDVLQKNYLKYSIL